LQRRNPIPTLRSLLYWIYRFLASMQLAVALIATLAVVLAGATFLEAARGREYVQWYVYHSNWFLTLLALLAVNILAATLIRFPWSFRQTGFLITHAGLLILLGGSVGTFFYGIEGQISLVEGDSAERFQIGDRSQLTARWMDSSPRPDRLPAAFIFEAGPSDWSADQALELGALSGVQLKVLKFYRHAQTREEWLPDETHASGPAVQLETIGPDGAALRQDWLVADTFGADLTLGSAKIQLQRIAADSMLDDFLQPPADMDPSGVLSMHYRGKMFRVPVGPNVGKKVPVGESGLSVEIAAYLPNAKPDKQGKFSTQGNTPENPMLELRVHVPGGKEPIRQVAFAQNPTLSFDAVHGGGCPVKFWYHHPAVVPTGGVDFVQTTQEKLYYRMAGKSRTTARGQCKLGDRVPLAGQFQLAIAQYLPHAKQHVSFTPAAVSGDDAEGLDSAALVEVQAGGVTAETWLKCGDSNYEAAQVTTSAGPLTLTFGHEHAPLGFTLKLLKFHRGLNPGGMGDASFASSVQLIDPAQGINQPREISMNEPLVHRQFTLFQSSFTQADDGRQASFFTVSVDPALYVKYLGCLMICGGTLLMFCTRAYARRNTAEAQK
jgi:hypothetical protein